LIWFFEPRTFRKIQLTIKILLLATGPVNWDGREIRRELVGFERFHVQFDQTHELASEVWRPIAAPVDQATCRYNRPSKTPYDADRFLNLRTSRNNIFGHYKSFSSRDFESSPQDKLPILLLHKYMPFPKISPDFLSNNDASHGRGNDGFAFDIGQFCRQIRTDLRRDIGMLQYQRALKVLPAVKAGTEDEMTLQQGFLLSEDL
jgi:hypothetical protein